MTRILLICLVALTASWAVTAAELPWSNPASIEIEINHSSGTGWMAPQMPYIDSSFTARYGKCPDFMIWADDPSIAVYIGADLLFRTTRKPVPSFAEVLPHLYVAAYGVKGQDSLRVPMEEVAYDSSRPSEYTPGRAFYTWRMNFRKIGIPADGQAWQVRLEVWKDPPPDGTRLLVSKPVDRPIVLNAPRTTPLDTLEWAYSSGLIRQNPDTCRWLLRYFPYSGDLLWSLLAHEIRRGDCDSMHYYAERYFYNESNRLDPIYMDRSFMYSSGVNPNPGPPPLSLGMYQQVIDSLLSICGDTTGLSQYEPIPPDSLPVFDHEEWIKRRQAEIDSINAQE